MRLLIIKQLRKSAFRPENKKNQAVFVCNSLIFSGIPGGARTHDPLIKSQLLYQLSYGNIPIIFACKGTKKMSVASTIRHFFLFLLKNQPFATASITFFVMYANCSSSSSVCIGSESTHAVKRSATGKSPAL